MYVQKKQKIPQQSDLTVEQKELFFAANEGGNIDVLRRVATRENIHFKVGPSDASLLHYAAWYGNYSCVELLLGLGINASVPDKHGVTPLHWCVDDPSFSPDRAKSIQLLVANGASLEEKSEFGDTPLFFACAFGCPESTEFLLSIGANKSAANNHGDTPLHIAAHSEKAESACKLLDNGADLLARNADGITPVDVAATQQVTNAILTHKLGTMSQENARLSQEVRDLKNLVMATAFFGNLDRNVDSTTTTTATAAAARRCLVPIQQQQQPVQEVSNINKDSIMNCHERQHKRPRHGHHDEENADTGLVSNHVLGDSISAPVYLMAQPCPPPPPTTPKSSSSSTIVASSTHAPSKHPVDEKSESMHRRGDNNVGTAALATNSSTIGVVILDASSTTAVSSSTTARPSTSRASILSLPATTRPLAENSPPVPKAPSTPTRPPAAAAAGLVAALPRDSQMRKNTGGFDQIEDDNNSEEEQQQQHDPPVQNQQQEVQDGSADDNHAMNRPQHHGFGNNVVDVLNDSTNAADAAASVAVAAAALDR
jgi:Ankyrin repeats (3 copies)/Ankyrin repeat